MDDKKELKYFKLIMTIFSVTYISLYILKQTGYYDVNIRNKTLYTESQIKEFEQDIMNGENMDIKTYLENQTKNYTNKASKMGYSISSNVNKIINKGLKYTLKFLVKFLD